MPYTLSTQDLVDLLSLKIGLMQELVNESDGKFVLEVIEKLNNEVAMIITDLKRDNRIGELHEENQQ